MDHNIPCPDCGQIEFCDACTVNDPEWCTNKLSNDIRRAYRDGTLFQIIESILAPPADA